MPRIAEIEPTPNPNSKKFVLKEPITRGVVRSFDSQEAANSDKLGRELFAIPHVTNVYYVDRWVTITQDGEADWPELLRKVAVPIRAAEADTSPMEAATTFEAKDPELQARLGRINELLDAQIRPALMMDGGGLEIKDFDGESLKIHYQGACGSCPSSLFGTLAAIEGLVHSIEPGLRVQAV